MSTSPIWTWQSGSLNLNLLGRSPSGVKATKIRHKRCFGLPHFGAGGGGVCLGHMCIIIIVLSIVLGLHQKSKFQNDVAYIWYGETFAPRSLFSGVKWGDYFRLCCLLLLCHFDQINALPSGCFPVTETESLALKKNFKVKIFANHLLVPIVME